MDNFTHIFNGILKTQTPRNQRMRCRNHFRRERRGWDNIKLRIDAGN